MLLVTRPSLITLVLSNAAFAGGILPNAGSEICTDNSLDRLMYYSEGARSDKATWRRDALPTSLLRALPKEMREQGDGFDNLAVDLNGDGVSEYLVFDRQSGSGGSEYAIMETKKEKWRLIGWIQGGFNIAPQVGKIGLDYSRIETWSRNGGTIYHSFWQYKNGGYKKFEAIEWPKEFTQDTPPFDDCCDKNNRNQKRRYWWNRYCSSKVM
jgi:hypothetical protein